MASRSEEVRASHLARVAVPLEQHPVHQGLDQRGKLDWSQGAVELARPESLLGAGRNYLSNEIAYRATLLRDAVGLDVPGGHIHTPVLQGLSSADRSELTNEEFEANRAAINGQIRDLVLVVAHEAASS